MRCRACNEAMSDRETNRKYVNWKEIENTEERYISLCDSCLQESDLFYMDTDTLDDTELDTREDGE